MYARGAQLIKLKHHFSKMIRQYRKSHREKSDGNELSLAEKANKLPKRYHAFSTPIVATPDTLNLEESTTAIFRLMSVAELAHAINTDIIGNDPRSSSYHALKKHAHLHMPEHVQENNSNLILSFARDATSAANYAGINVLPNFYALVRTNLPPVFTVPADHAMLDQSVFDSYHQYYRAKEMHTCHENGTKYTPPVNASILSRSQQEVDMVINTPNGTCDFRPMANEMILNINFICGGFRSYTFVSDPAPIAHLPMQRDWAIEVLCPVDERNYSKMLASSRDKTLIPPYSRPLTVDDAVAIFPELIRIFPASYNNQHSHVHILKYVPEDYPVGSPRVVQFLIKEHSLFRKQHSCVTEVQHDYMDRNLSPRVHKE